MLIAPWAVLAAVAAPSSGSWRPPELEVAPPPPVTSFAELQAIALRYLGRPYVWGGVGTPGLDCSGFTCRVFAEAGYALPRVSRDQARIGRKVPLNQIAPGDLLFFAEAGAPISHVGIYLGDGEMVHASSGQGEVVVDTLRRRWYSQTLVSARRVLSSTLTKGADDLLVITELSEHDGRFRLSPFVRKRAQEVDPGLEPILLGGGYSFVGVRSGVVTQDGRAGGIIAPEVGFSWRKHGVSLQFGVPIRLDPTEGAEIGGFDDASDALRFVREVRVGVRGADIEVALVRERAFDLGEGRVVRSHAPLFAAQLIPGLGTRGSPLSGYHHLRIESLEVQALVDDVARPGLIGGAAGWYLPKGFVVRAEVATDLRTADERDLFAAHGAGFFESPPDRALQLAVDLGGGGSALGGDQAGWIDGEATLRIRFGDRYGDLVGVGGRLGYAFDGGLWDLFGPTYPAARAPTAAGFGLGGTRPLGGGHFMLRVGPVEASARYHQALGGQSGPLDRALELSAELADLPLAGTRTLSLRAGYAARAPFEAERIDVAHARAALRLTKLLSLEAYALMSDAWEGGATLRFAWVW